MYVHMYTHKNESNIDQNVVISGLWKYSQKINFLQVYKKVIQASGLFIKIKEAKLRT